MSESAGKVVPLGFTKLVVDDMDKMSKFYGAVCGLIEEGRAEDLIGGRPIGEVYFRSDPPGTGTFTLTKFLDVSKPMSEGVILGFIAEDIDQFVEKAVAAGSTVIEPAHPRPDHGVKVAFVRDLEGNLIEVVEIM